MKGRHLNLNRAIRTTTTDTWRCMHWIAVVVCLGTTCTCSTGIASSLGERGKTGFASNSPHTKTHSEESDTIPVPSLGSDFFQCLQSVSDDDVGRAFHVKDPLADSRRQLRGSMMKPSLRTPFHLTQIRHLERQCTYSRSGKSCHLFSRPDLSSCICDLELPRCLRDTNHICDATVRSTCSCALFLVTPEGKYQNASLPIAEFLLFKSSESTSVVTCDHQIERDSPFAITLSNQFQVYLLEFGYSEDIFELDKERVFQGFIVGFVKVESRIPSSTWNPEETLVGFSRPSNSRLKICWGILELVGISPDHVTSAKILVHTVVKFSICFELDKKILSQGPRFSHLLILENGVDWREREYHQTQYFYFIMKTVPVIIPVLLGIMLLYDLFRRPKCGNKVGCFTDKWTATSTYAYSYRNLATDRMSRLWTCFFAVFMSSFFCMIPQSTACSLDSSSLNLSGFPCLEYHSNLSMFELTCSFHWSEANSSVDCISLKKNEIFEGNGNEINITGYNSWEGLFGIEHSNSETAPSSLDNAPIIRNLHMIGGESSNVGGFIVQAEQKHFIVESCSSTGVIRGTCSPCRGGGGICGYGCSGDILIKNCSSTGKIGGTRAGGIAGSEVGVNGNGNTVNITNCQSAGSIAASGSGGICGWGAGVGNGKVAVTYSYSTGKIEGDRSGGICGQSAGYQNGEIAIDRCYSLGEINGPLSGGITGRHTAYRNGYVSITNSYSRGTISGSNHAGGICGSDTGSTSGGLRGGTVILTNVYASGGISKNDSGGLIGQISTDAKQINVTMSVYNGNSHGSMIGENANTITVNEKNSDTLNDIIGTAYCYYGDQEKRKECWDDETTWQAVKDHYPILQDMPRPPPPSPSPPMATKTLTPTVTKTTSQSQTYTPSVSASPTPSPSGTPSTSQKPRRIFTQLPVQRPRRRVV